jgi:hypothetical protein
MASTYSQYKIELVGTGEQAGTWGTTTNNNFGSATPGTYQGFEQAIGGRADVTMSGTTTLSLTNSNAAQDARALYLNLSGTLSGAADLVVPALQKSYLVKNGTTGGFAVTIKVTGQTGVSIPNGKTVWVYNNGTDVVTAVDFIPEIATTTVDATNIEVTNIKAKDGTSAGSIADSTGVVTLASSVLTTTDINGGTIDGAVIGCGGRLLLRLRGHSQASTPLAQSCSTMRGPMSIFGYNKSIIFNVEGYDTDANLRIVIWVDAGGLLTLKYFWTGLAGIGIRLGYTDATYTEPPAEIAFVITTDTGGTNGSIVFGTRSVTTNTAVTERMRIDSSGQVIVGPFGGNGNAVVAGSSSPGATNQPGTNLLLKSGDGSGSGFSFMTFSTSPAGSSGTTVNTAAERARITSGGQFLVGKTADVDATAGTTIDPSGLLKSTVDGSYNMYVNRLSSDGTLVYFAQANTVEGEISVSGSTVSYLGGHLSRWAQMLTKPDLVKGTVMSNLDEMNVYVKPTLYWTEDDELPVDEEGNPTVAVGDLKQETSVSENEQLNKVKVSDVEGDPNVAGVFVNWTYDEAHQVDEINMAMTGDMIIRIAEGVTVARGDLLMSAGDGTAKPQGDDIVRSKTIAKVTSTHVTCTYEDGSYCVPCVLMAC